MIIPVILSGGSGTRLWPLSRALHPKQLLPMVTDATMIQDTVSRLHGLADLSAPIFVCNDEHRFMIAEQMREINVTPSSIILEPFGRNTAPAVAISAMKAEEIDNDAVMLVLPADHIIQNTEAFHKAITTGYEAAINNNLVTFGVVPDSAKTGYGYIKAGNAISTDTQDVCTVEQFVEKPDKQTAETYLKQGGYYWNSGMFMFKASEYLKELEQFNNEILLASKQSLDFASVNMDFIRLDKASFEVCPCDSIDYAVMEKTKKAVVVPVDIGWNDIGSLSALCDMGNSDEQGNVKYGDVYTFDTNNSYIHSESRLVATVGLNDHIVVETADAVMIAHRDKAQDVKEIVEQLKADQRVEAINHHTTHRPWGVYKCIDREDQFQVKRITVNPGARLSLQLHNHRAEHWTVVKGTAKVTCGEKEFVLSENQSTYIPIGEKHRLENPEKIPLEIIEVQTGSYLGEDNIVRFEDAYGR